MTSSNDDIIKAILQYQERLDRYSQNKSEDKMLYVIGKLSKLQIRTLHLETTGIGRTVNALKKLGGAVGEAAKDLVNLWKGMVLEEEKAAQETSIEDDADSVYSSENENKDCQKQDSSKENISHSENESEGYGSKPEIHIENESGKYNKGDSRSKASSSSSSSESSSSSTESEKEIYRKRKEHHSRKRNRSYNSSSDDKETHHSKKKSKKEIDHSSQDKHTHKSSRENKSSKRDENTTSRHKETLEKHKKNSDKCKEESKHKSKKDAENESKHKSDKRYDEEKKLKHKEDSKAIRSSNKTKKHEEKENSSHHKSEKHGKHYEKTDKNVKSSHSSKDKQSSSDKKEKHESRRDRKEEKPESKSKEDKKKDSSKSKDSSSKHKSSLSDDQAKKKVKLDKVTNVNKQEIVHGIDSGSGASFAEALGMCGPLGSSPRKKTDKPKLSQNLSKSLDNVEIESTKNKKSKNDDSGSSKFVVPELLKEEPIEPLNVCLSSLLPEITPNYKPLGISFDSQPKRLYTDDEALSRVMTNKNQRTKVYSGNKTVGKVETLFQLCVRVLQDNIDALEYTGGVPYIILKPIMERATADQIFNLEHHNPYLIEDTDELWQLHCQKDFRTKQRQEMESWRDMYMRCLDEREARLNAVKANIKLSQDKSIPVRTTKLAYVDSEFVKPPRNVARKQAKNGTINTDRKTTTTQKLTALAQSGEASKVAVPDPGRRAADRSGGSGTISSSAVMKPKKAPLMAKTLSFMKNRFRR